MGDVVTRSFQVTVSNMPAFVNEITNVVMVADDGTNGEDRNPEDNTGEDTDEVIAAPVLGATKVNALVVDWDNTGMVTPGDTVEYTIVVTNSGNQDAAGVELHRHAGRAHQRWWWAR